MWQTRTVPVRSQHTIRETSPSNALTSSSSTRPTLRPRSVQAKCLAGHSSFWSYFRISQISPEELQQERHFHHVWLVALTSSFTTKIDNTIPAELVMKEMPHCGCALSMPDNTGAAELPAKFNSDVGELLLYVQSGAEASKMARVWRTDSTDKAFALPVLSFKEEQAGRGLI